MMRGKIYLPDEKMQILSSNTTSFFSSYLSSDFQVYAINKHKNPTYIHTMTKYTGISKVSLRGEQPSQGVLDRRNF